jgi:uncharacterized membrane protein YdjX (TVP38/TMEM64 family)
MSFQEQKLPVITETLFKIPARGPEATMGLTAASRQPSVHNHQMQNLKLKGVLGMLAIFFAMLLVFSNLDRINLLYAWLDEQKTAGLAYIESLPVAYSAFAFFVVITLSTVSVVITTTPLNFVVGGLYGIWMGGSIMLAGCVVGSIINFIIGRYLAKGWATRQLEKSPILQSIDKAIARDSFNVIVLSRLSPVLPFAILGFVLGVTSVSLTEFTLATAVGMTPGCLLYAWIGQSTREAAGATENSWSQYIPIVISVTATIAISIKAKQLFEQATKNTKSNV